MVMPPAEVTMTHEFYALGNNRSAKTVRGFLDHFLPEREPCCSDYPVLESSDAPLCVLRAESEILGYMERHPNEPYGLYWNDGQASSTQAMVFYTRDGHVIFGLAEDTAEPTRRLRELADFVGAEYSALGSEQRPPDTASEFIALCSA
jgi:hypothetical protein